MFADTFVVGKYVPGEPFKAVTTNKELYRTNALPSSPVIKADITPWDGKSEEKTKEKLLKEENTEELAKVNGILGVNLTNLD